MNHWKDLKPGEYLYCDRCELDFTPRDVEGFKPITSLGCTQAFASVRVCGWNWFGGLFGNVDHAVVTLRRDQAGAWRYLYSGKIFPLSQRVAEMADAYEAVLKLQKESKDNA